MDEEIRFLRQLFTEAAEAAGWMVESGRHQYSTYTALYAKNKKGGGKRICLDGLAKAYKMMADELGPRAAYEAFAAAAYATFRE